MNPEKKIKISREELVEKLAVSLNNIPIDKMCENHNSMLQSNSEVLNYIRNAETFMKKLKLNTKRLNGGDPLALSSRDNVHRALRREGEGGKAMLDATLPLDPTQDQKNTRV